MMHFLHVLIVGGERGEDGFRAAAGLYLRPATWLDELHQLTASLRPGTRITVVHWDWDQGGLRHEWTGVLPEAPRARKRKAA
ncbi:MAG: hypothetical protein KF782_34800 [Labilithrix sp.]|nr:hypothetical protein [Labilithrix sp.]